MKLKTFVSLSLSTVVVTLSLIAHAQTFSVIHTFRGGGDGAAPYAGLTLDSAGNLYGTASAGGRGAGIVYELKRHGTNWTVNPLYDFTGGADGSSPLGGVVFGPDNHLYGTTYEGGTYGRGVVFYLAPPPTVCRSFSCFWDETVLHQFMGGNDGANPELGDLTLDAAGNIWGETQQGYPTNLGAVFELQYSGTGWSETVIYGFSGSNGWAADNMGVVLDHNGNVFGTTGAGGLYSNCFQNCGTVYELMYSVGLGWTETNPYNFQNGTDGSYPVAGLVFDGSGNLYGAASNGGSGGGGTVFELSPSGDTWTFTTLYSFSGTESQPQGCGPWGTLTFNATFTSLYGTTDCDGTNQMGNVFELTKSGNTWVYTDLYDFTGSNDGANPIGGVTIDPNNGTLYGTAVNGGDLDCSPPYGCGTVWMITP